MTTTDTIFGPAGPLALGPSLGSGGEGVVYELGSDRAAKLYAARPDAEHSKKLGALIAAGNADLKGIAAWPDMLLRDRAGDVVGFAMPKIVDRVPLHRLFAPTTRKTIAPDRHWGFLAHVGRNLAAAVATIHAAGAVVADLNDRNTLVSLATGEVSLIDVDSFQFAAEGVTYPSAVGVDLYLPPELQGKTLADVVRTPDHDAFALAVLIFRLLMMGRHPYGGVNYPRGTDDTDLARIVQHLPFAYGSRAEEAGIRRPPQSLALSALTSELAVLFEQAFERREMRPAPEFWVRGLERFEAELVACRSGSLHRFVAAAGPCPWCALEREGYVAFVGAATAGALPSYDTLADRRWLASVDLGAAAHPQIVPERPALRPRRPHATWLGWTVWSTFAAGAAATDIGLMATHGLAIPTVGVFWVAAWNLRRHVPPKRRTRRIAKLRDGLARAEAQWQRSLDAWRTPAIYARANDTLAQFRALLDFVERPKTDLARRMLELEGRKRDLQLEAYLAGFALAACKLPSINARVRESLAAYGIATASDVRRLDRLKIPDVGPGRRLVLLEWREKLARRFTYDPAAPLPRHAIAAVEAEHAEAFRTALQRLPTLRAAATDLLARAEEARRIASEQLAFAASELGRARRKLADLGERYA